MQNKSKNKKMKIFSERKFSQITFNRFQSISIIQIEQQNFYM
jgi:hypothetical protein